MRGQLFRDQEFAELYCPDEGRDSVPPSLVADGIVQVVRALAALDGTRPEEWARKGSPGLYFGSSVKGETAIDWDRKQERRALLQKIVADAGRVIELLSQTFQRL